MYHYAYVNANDICEGIYSLPTPITGAQYIAIASNDQTLVGQHYNRETEEFEPVYYYAHLDADGIVTDVTFSATPLTTSATFLSITFTQYQTVTGMYWNGTEFVEPPFSLIAVASTDEINVKGTDTVLSDKLDAMDSATATNTANIATISGNMNAVVADLTTIADSISALATVVGGKANATHTHTAADLSGVVKTVNGTAPDASGNIEISVSGGGMTAAEIMAAVQTQDGTGSGLDADLLDGMDSSAFALADHSHTGYASAEHTHDSYLTAEDIAGKADSVHTHEMAQVNGLTAALNGKADSDHMHDGYADADHTHTGFADANTVDALADEVAGKSDVGHTHSEYAESNHSHSEYAPASHSHSGYLQTSGGAVNGNLNVAGILRVNGQQFGYDSGTMVTVSTNNRETMIAGSKIYSKTTISVSSDERLKEGIQNAPVNALAAMVDNIKLREYSYIGSDEKNVGVIAQELIANNPKLEQYFVRTDNDGYYSVKTADFVFPLIAAVQALGKRVAELEKSE